VQKDPLGLFKLKPRIVGGLPRRKKPKPSNTPKPKPKPKRQKTIQEMIDSSRAFVNSLKGGNMASRTSVVVFSMHRSASTFMADFLKTLSKKSGMRHGHIDPMLESQKVNQNKPIRRISPGFAKKLSPTNMIYGPFRRYLPFPDIKDYNAVMVLRDPRDVLVSLFYAQVFSHGPPPDPKRKAAYLEKSRRAKQAGIDKTVLEWAQNMVRIYGVYMEAQKKHQIPLLTYGEMVTNFKVFLHKFLSICDLSEFYDDMIRFDKFGVKKEDAYAHKRQVKPGDHRRKLKKATIKQLDERLGHIIRWLNMA